MSTNDMTQRVALVTGGNRGIGLGICRQLAAKGLHVILATRSIDNGNAAIAKLSNEGLQASLRQLDVDTPASIDDTFAWIRKEIGRLDILVNNAGISIDGGTHTGSTIDVALMEQTLRTNFLGPLRLSQAVLPIMQAGGYGRIVNVSSGLGSFTRLVKTRPAYRISKTALNALTKILADEYQNTNILINAMTPGWVRTQMGGIRAPRSVDEGADTAVWLATLPDDGPNGRFFRDREEFPW